MEQRNVVTYDNCIVLDSGKGLIPRWVKIELPDGTKKIAVWNSELNLEKGMIVRAKEHLGNPVLSIKDGL